MKNFRPRIGPFTVALALTGLALGQGQNMFQSTALGDQYLLNPAPPMFNIPPRSVHIGTSANGCATLRVRGDQLPVFDQFNVGSVCTFRTDVTSGNSQNWSMVSGALEIGRFYHLNGNSLIVQARQRNGALWLRNGDPVTGGLGAFRLAFDGNGLSLGGTFSVNGFVHNPYGYAALGAVGSINTFNPWARFSLMHQNLGTAQQNIDIQTCFRPWFGNAVLGMGNADLYYFGHKYQLLNGTGAEQPDNSNVVAAWGEPNLPAGLAHHFDNFQFRFIGATDATTTVGSIDGLELMRLRPYRLNAGDAVPGFVGIGDWTAANTGPEERFDILNGRMRHRQLPTDLEMTTATKAMVVDDNGIVGWRPYGGAGSSCNWTYVPSANRIYTAYDPVGVGSCPQKDWLMGVGASVPATKLDVYTERTTGNATGAIRGIMKATRMRPHRPVLLAA